MSARKKHTLAETFKSIESDIAALERASASRRAAPVGLERMDGNECEVSKGCFTNGDQLRQSWLPYVAFRQAEAAYKKAYDEAYAEAWGTCLEPFDKCSEKCGEKEKETFDKCRDACNKAHPFKDAWDECKKALDLGGFIPHPSCTSDDASCPKACECNDAWNKCDDVCHAKQDEAVEQCMKTKLCVERAELCVKMAATNAIDATISNALTEKKRAWKQGPDVSEFDVSRVTDFSHAVRPIPRPRAPLTPGPRATSPSLAPPARWR